MADPAPSPTVRCTVLPASARDPEGWDRRELEIRRSRFLTYLGRVEDEAQARAMVAALRRRHHDARHVCSAFVLGPARDRMRSSDDGEPAGTAGAPMLEALALRETGPGRADLTDVCAVVVRWFGGVKLGAGGLVRAYSESVSGALDAASFVTRSRMALLGVDAPHADAGRWESGLRASGVAVLDTAYGAAGARLTVGVPDTDEARAAFAARLADVTAGAGRSERIGEEWVDHE